MRKSEIFDSFAKIAEEKGLISKSSPEETQKKLEKTRRMDSLSIADIAKLYGTKPNTPKGMEYERNIVEVAHPSAVVIAPSYDKLNGLVENINERQDILLHIVNKTNNGYLTNTKYAEKELILSLVRIGNDLDNRDQSDLVSLADTCLAQATARSLRKVSQLLPIAAIVAGLLGALYAKQHLAFHSDGFELDFQKAIQELDDLIESNSNLGIGYDYKPEFIAMVNDIKNKLNELNVEVQKVLPLLNKLDQPKPGSQLKQLIQQAQQSDTQEVLHALQEFKKKVYEDLYPYFRKVLQDFSNEGFKQRQIEHKGVISNMIDSTGILHGGKGLIADDFDDVAHALQAVLGDITNIVKGLQGADNLATNAQQQLQAAQAAIPQETSTPSNETQSEAPSDADKGVADLEQEYSDLIH
jgi:hypothetical protein